MEKVDKRDLKKFILEASRATYASGNQSIQEKQSDRSTTIQFEKGEYKYHDNFFGGEPYGGREVIFYHGKPIWMMVYYGLVFPGVDNKQVYPFLMKALSNATADTPYRGPLLFEEGGWKYKNTLLGDVERFSGTERISIDGIGVYEASFLGGLVDQ
jgi:hypothetical protein